MGTGFIDQYWTCVQCRERIYVSLELERGATEQEPAVIDPRRHGIGGSEGGPIFGGG